MNLQDIFDELTFGELSQLAISNHQNSDGSKNCSPEMSDADKVTIVRHINTALTALYTRFRLREKSVIINLVADKATYVLHSRYASTNTNSDELVKYLIDVADTFDDSLLKVEQISTPRVDLGLGESRLHPMHILDLNKTNSPFSLRTPSHNIISVPDDFGYDIEPTQLHVQYRAKHPTINPATGPYSAPGVLIELPTTHLQALLFHVASRIMNPTGMIEEFHSGNNWYAKYEGECARLEQEGMEIDDMEENSAFERQGYA